MTDTAKKDHKRQLKALELREQEISVAKAEIDLEIRLLDRVRHNHQHGLLLDSNTGTFRLEDAVYSEVLSLGTAMQRWGDAHPGAPLTLYIFSPGGSVLHGLALYDTLRTLSREGHEITTVIRGFAGSMASVLFLAGDVRKIGAESIIHQHEPSSMAYGKLSEMTDANEFVKTLFEKITRIYVDRTSMTRTTFRKKTVGKEWHAEAAEALALGLATEIA